MKKKPVISVAEHARRLRQIATWARSIKTEQAKEAATQCEETAALLEAALLQDYTKDEVRLKPEPNHKLWTEADIISWAKMYGLHTHGIEAGETAQRTCGFDNVRQSNGTHPSGVYDLGHSHSLGASLSRNAKVPLTGEFGAIEYDVSTISDPVVPEPAQQYRAPTTDFVRNCILSNSVVPLPAPTPELNLNIPNQAPALGTLSNVQVAGDNTWTATINYPDNSSRNITLSGGTIKFEETIARGTYQATFDYSRYNK